MVSVSRELVDCIFDEVEVAHHQIWEWKGFGFKLEFQGFEEDFTFGMVVGCVDV